LLSFVAIPLAVLRPLELRHRWLMQVFVSFADPDGKCWPSLKTLAEKSGEHLSWVKRNVKEALDLSYLSREPRQGGGYTYTIDKRFLPVRGKPVLVSRRDPPAAPTAGTAGVPTVRAGVPMVGPEEHLEEQLPPLPPRSAGGVDRKRREGKRGGSGAASIRDVIPAEPWEQRCRSFARGYRWDDAHCGPAPGEPGCRAPAALAAEALRLRAGGRAAA